MERAGGRESLVLAVMLVIVGGTWGFVLLADEVREGGTQRFDDWAIRALRQPDDPAQVRGPRWLQEVARDVTALGGVTVLTLVTLAVAGYLLMERKLGAMWLVVGATVSGLIASSLLKGVIARDRPHLVPHLSYVYTSSFPSGHSMLSAVVYLTLGSLLMRLARGRAVKIYFLAVALVLTFLIGVSRVYMGVHYPTDVLAGWTAGLVWALLCWLVARSLQRRRLVERDV
jgi:undecaprenyl-diphosphatase